MASLVTQALKDTINCCTVSEVATVATKSQRGALSPSFLYSAALKVAQNEILQEYVPTGTVLVPSRVSYAILDLTDPAPPTLGDLVGEITVNGVVVGIIPEANYVLLADLTLAIADAINNGGSGFSSIDNLDGTVTVISPPTGPSLNGFEVEIIINPAFQVDTTLNTGSLVLRQMIHVNDPTSGLYGHTLVAEVRPGQQFVVDLFNKAFVQRTQVLPNPDPTSLIPGSGAHALAHRQFNDTLAVLANAGASAWVLSNTFVRIGLLTGTFSGQDSVYNTFNSCLYFGNTVGGNVRKVDALDVATVIAGVDVDMTSPQTAMMAVDTVQGYVWVLCAAGAGGIKRIHPTTDAVTNINTGTDQPRCITYYPGNGTPGTDRMFVGFSNVAAIREYNMDGTVATATFYPYICRGIIYSTKYNVLLASQNEVTVIRMDGTLKQTIAATAICYFVEDVNNSLIIGHNGSSTVYWLNLTNDGVDEYVGELGDGTPAVVQTEADQCVPEAAMNSLVQKLSSDCGCADCGDTSNVFIPAPPSGGSYVIYYGNSTDAALTAVGIVDELTASAQATYAANYLFGATSPSEYKYIVILTSLGTPTRFYDPLTLQDIVMYPSYAVIINSVSYTVYRTYYGIGSILNITVNS